MPYNLRPLPHRRAYKSGGGYRAAVAAAATAAAAAGHPVSRALYRIGKHVYSKWRGHSSKKVKKIDDSRGIQMESGHSGLQRSTLKLRRKKKLRGLRKVEKLSGNILYKMSFSCIQGGTSGTQPGQSQRVLAGTQSTVRLGDAATVSQFTTSTGVNYYQTSYKSESAWFDLNPSEATTGSAVFAAAATPLNDVMYIKSVTMNVEFTNFGAVAAYIDVYLCTPKVVSINHAIDDWNLGYQYDALGQSALVPPVPGASTGTSGYGNAFYPTARPRESIVFSKMWKICAVKTINLASAASEVVNLDIKIGRTVRRDYLLNLPSGSMYVPNLSYCAFAVVRGSLVQDNTSGAGSNVVTYGEVKWGYINNMSVRLAPVVGTGGRVRVDRFVQTFPKLTSGPNQTILNEVDASSNVQTAQAA